jgi:hypothetical protein
MITQDDIDGMKEPVKQIKVPGPGQFRGEGEWEPYTDFCRKAHLTPEAATVYWDELQTTGFLPTKEE